MQKRKKKETVSVTVQSSRDDTSRFADWLSALSSRLLALDAAQHNARSHRTLFVECENWMQQRYRTTTVRRRTRNCTRMTCRSFMEPAVMPMECAHHGGENVSTNQRPFSTGFCVREPHAPRDFTARPRDTVAPPTTRPSSTT